MSYLSKEIHPEYCPHETIQFIEFNQIQRDTPDLRHTLEGSYLKLVIGLPPRLEVK